MRLNQDCIRDIILYVEANTETFDTCIGFEELCSALSYDKKTLDYHIRMLHEANLFTSVYYSEGSIEFVTCLSFEGHSYADNIRDNKVWKTIKKGVNTLTSVSLPILMKHASDVVINSLPK